MLSKLHKIDFNGDGVANFLSKYPNILDNETTVIIENFGKARDSVLLVEKCGEMYYTCRFSNNKEKQIVETRILSSTHLEELLNSAFFGLLYSLDEENEFKISYYAISDEDTLVNLTNHSYFNLSGNCKSNILNHYLYIDSDFLVELNEKEVPTGKTIKIDKTPFDFNSPKTIGRDIEEENYQLKIGNGYDHCWLLNGGNDIKIRLYHKESGRQMDVYTDQNSVVLYSLNYPDDEILECNKKANRRDALAIETQSPPIGENNIFANYSLLKKGEEYIKETIYKFSIIE